MPPVPSLRARMEAGLDRIESGGNVADAVMDLIVVLCAYYREVAAGSGLTGFV